MRLQKISLRLSVYELFSTDVGNAIFNPTGY